MIQFKKIQPLNDTLLEEIGFQWHTDEDLSKYIADELIRITPQEAEAYYIAANEVYDMYVQAAQYVIDNNLFFDLGIPFNLIDLIKNSWENDVHWHLYGRFDFAGGIDGKPIKLIEFNADTPTSLYETSILQWALLIHNGLNETQQFNNIYEAIGENFKRLITLFDDPDHFSELYEGWKILFSSVSSNAEEERTVQLLKQIASDAGFQTHFEPLSNVKFDNDGIYDQNETPYEYWFKLYPWEDIAIEEPELATLLNTITTNQKSIILNPAYTLLFQSKGMLKILCDLFPDSPYLLHTSFQPLTKGPYVEKRMFGREGANVKIINENGSILEENSGPYGNFKPVYQEYIEFPKDTSGMCYQAGVFFSYEACGLGFRKGSSIINNSSKFVGHFIQ